MTEREYKRQHIMLWRGIIKYLYQVKRGKEKIYYKSIVDLKSALLKEQNENSGVTFTRLYNDFYSCDFALTESSIDMCMHCPLINKLGCYCLDEYSGAYALLVKAYISQDYEKAIRLARKIRDAWREVK